MGRLRYGLIKHKCLDGECFVIYDYLDEKDIGALKLNQRDVGLAIIDELNSLSSALDYEQCRTTPIVLSTKISEEDYQRLDNMFMKYFKR